VFRKRTLPATGAHPLTSRADVVTATPERFAKQLVSHLGHRVTVEETAAGHVLRFDAGRGLVQIHDGVLVLQAQADDETSLAVVQDVLGRHLLKFGAKHELTVTWSLPAPA